MLCQALRRASHVEIEAATARSREKNLSSPVYAGPSEHFLMLAVGQYSSGWKKPQLIDLFLQNLELRHDFQS